MGRFAASMVFILLLLPAAAGAADFGFHGGAHLGYGHEGVDDPSSTYTSRAMGTLDLQAMPGFRFYGKSILAGLLLDFRILSQLSSASKDAIGDFGGNGLTVGPGVIFDFSFGMLGLSWDWRDRQSITQPDGTLKGSGFHFLFGYRWTPKVTLDLEYVIARYNDLAIGPVETGLGSSPVSHKNVGLGVSVSL